VLGSAKKDDVPGNAKEDDAQHIKDENNSPSSHIAILPLMTRSTTHVAEDVSGVSIVHHVVSSKETKPNDAMDTELRINAINKEVRGLINRRAFSLCTSTQYIHTLISSARETSLNSNTLTQSTMRQNLA
jgi:hypothetical protein